MSGLRRHANYEAGDTMNCILPKDSEDCITLDDLKGETNCCGIYKKFSVWKNTKGSWLSKANGKDFVANIGIISTLNAGFVFGAMTAIDGEKLQEASAAAQYATWVVLVISFLAFVFSTWETVQYYWFDSMGLNGSGFAQIAEYMFYIGFLTEIAGTILVVIILSGEVLHGIATLITALMAIPIFLYLHFAVGLKNSIAHTKRMLEENDEVEEEKKQTYPAPDPVVSPLSATSTSQDESNLLVDAQT